jgi:Beta xylosidase C-terminal Concanavalin A-like domain
LRLFAQPLPSGGVNLWSAPNLLLQKFPAPAFVATTRVSLRTHGPDTMGGIIVFGTGYWYLGARLNGNGFQLVEGRCPNAASGGVEEQVEYDIVAVDGPLPPGGGPESIYLRATIDTDAVIRWSYGTDGEHFDEVGTAVVAKAGRWVGAKVGPFAVSNSAGALGYADFDFLRVTAPEARSAQVTRQTP